MKAFVIKHKEGKYRGNSYIGDVRDIRHAEIYDTKEEILLDDNEEIVEVTITEGDLEQQLAEKDKEIEKLKYQLTYYQTQVSQEEIERFNNNMLAQTRPYEELEGKLLYEISQIYQNQIRKQVCNKIRTYDRITNKQKVSYTEYVMGLCEFLDQIEQGE